MALYFIHYGIFSGESMIIEADSKEDAEQEAYFLAVQDYESYEGFHGVMDRSDIADDYNLDIDSEEVEDLYNEEVESCIEYYAELYDENNEEHREVFEFQKGVR